MVSAVCGVKSQPREGTALAALTPLSLRSSLHPLTLTNIGNCCWKLILSSLCWRCQLQIRPACRVTAWALSDGAEGGTAESLEPLRGGRRALARRPGEGGWQCCAFSSRECHLPTVAVASLGLSAHPGGSSCVSFSGGTPEMMFLV